MATLEQQGLFWLVHCQCAVKIREPLKIIVTTGAERIDLGVCVNHAEGCGLSARIPARQLKIEEAAFLLEVVCDDSFTPVATDRPFPAIDKLEHAIFTVHNGQTGIILKD